MAAMQSRAADLPLTGVIRQLLAPERDVLTQEVAGARVLVRADLNAPLTRDGQVAERARIDAALPLLRALCAKGARVVVASHLGRPEPGKEDEAVMRARDSLRPVAQVLQAELGACFRGLAEDVVGPSAQALAASLAPGDLCLLENTRFEAGDTANDPQLARALAALCDVFVLDGFGVCHREQASVSGVARCVARRFPGPLVRRELTFLGAAMLDTPRRPLCFVLGGANVRDKIGVLRSLLQKADTLLVGGRMAFTFLAARGVRVGATQIEADWVSAAREMEEAADAAGVRLLLPMDVLVSSSLDAPINTQVVKLSRGCCTDEQPCIPAGAFGVDIGPDSCRLFADAIAGCASILWNGPMGRFEVPQFAEGTQALVAAMAGAHAKGAVTVVAGGDSVAALGGAKGAEKVSFVSTCGGASLQLLEGKSMPGLEALL